MNAFRHSGYPHLDLLPLGEEAITSSPAGGRGLRRGWRSPARRILLLTFVLIANICSLSSAHAAELGRLFYTPQQRAQLDAGQTSPDNPEGGGRSYITVNGVIQKQGGKRTVWINGQPQPAENGNEKTPATVPVAVPGKPRPVQLKVGQRLLLNTPPPSTTEEDKSEKAAPTKPTEEDD